MALVKLGVYDPVETLEGQDAADVQAQANLLIDSWNTDRRFIYANQFWTGMLTPNLQPHLIGPQGTNGFVMNQRPVKIEDANILLQANGAPPYINAATVRCRVTVRQDKGKWWAAQLAPGIQSVLPTDMYYEEDWPNGSMYLWVVPTVAYPLEILFWTVLQQYRLTDTVFMPPGYLLAFVLSLAELIAPDFAAAWTPALDQLKRTALRRVQGPNLVSPRLGTCDAGIPGKRSGNRSNYNYLSKQFNT
jgi:hypothetical protein